MLEDASKAANANADVVQRWGGRVPIVIGATGHRNIFPADGKLTAALRAECHKLKKQYGSSPFVVLSALAEGADRMIAAVAMEELKADLIAVLPMPAFDFERDFQTEDSKREFRDLLARALWVRVAPVPAGSAWKADGEPRNQQYARAGSIIVEHAQVLFAIWDGKPARGTGGTADQVAWFDRGYAPNEYSLYEGALSPLTPLEPGLRIHIDSSTAAASLGETRQPESGKSDIRQILKLTNRYNQDAAKARDAIAQAKPPVEGAVETVKALSVANGVYRAADCLSVDFANKVRGSDALVYILALIAVAAFNFISLYWFVPWLYLAVTVMIALLTVRVLAFSVDNRFLEYRCLAESMRTLFFWRSAGIKRPVWLGYLSRQAGVVHWIRHAARTAEFCQDCELSQRTPGSVHPDGIAFVKQFWVEDQKKWFQKRELAHFRNMKTWKRIARAALTASFITAVVLALLTRIHNAQGDALWSVWVEPKHLGDLWQMVLGLFAAGGLAARGFLTRRADLELAKQYASQRQIFETASRLLNEPKCDWTAQQILERLGDEALQEQSEWVWLRHTRPFEVPVP